MSRGRCPIARAGRARAPTIREGRIRSMAGQRMDGIIDCDIHQQTNGPEDLFPYLSKAYQERIRLFGTGLSQRVGYPNGGDRAASGGRVARRWTTAGAPTLHLMREQHLDLYNVEYGLLLGQEFRPTPRVAGRRLRGGARARLQRLDDRALDHARRPAERARRSSRPRTRSMAAKEIERIGPHPGIVGALVPNGARVPVRATLLRSDLRSMRQSRPAARAPHGQRECWA